MHSTYYKLTELFILFVLIPLSFTINYALWIKVVITVVGFSYVLFMLVKVYGNKWKLSSHLNWKQFFTFLMIQLLVIAVLTFVYLWLVDRPRLFFDVINNPLKWLLLSCVYVIFSVYPQELLYRTFFFQRYRDLFKTTSLLIFVNAILFSLAHLFFRNTLVMIMTFIGGILFAITYNRTRSTLLVSIEHAVYGVWLYTVGMGSMLGFPE